MEREKGLKNENIRSTTKYNDGIIIGYVYRDWEIYIL